MKIKTDFYWGFVVVFMVVLLFFQKNDFENKIAQRISKTEFEKHIETDRVRNNNDLNREFLQFASSNKKINTSISLERENGKTIQLKDLLDSEYRLFFNFTDINCSSCIAQEVGNIKKFANSTGVKHIVLIAKYRLSRDLIVFKRRNNLRMDIYNTKNQKLGLKIEEYNLPFYFIANNEGETKQVFIPEKERPNLSTKYYEAISGTF